MTNDINKFLVFESADSLYAVEYRYIKETAVKTQHLTVDYLDPNIIGIVNIKGSILPVLNPFGKMLSSSIKPGIMIVIFTERARFSLSCSDLVDIISMLPDKIYQIQSREADFILEYFNYKERCVHIIDIERYITFLDKNLDSEHPRYKEVF